MITAMSSSSAKRLPFCAKPVDPATLVGDAWMRDPAALAEFERLLEEGRVEMKPLTDAIRDSEHLTEHDFGIVINTRD